VRDVDAVVFDAPVLLYYAANEGKAQGHMVGFRFRKEGCGIMFQPNNALSRQVNDVPLFLREHGTYEQLYDKWFAGT
jgi:polar amino acid transport system substrate-binding protein